MLKWTKAGGAGHSNRLECRPLEVDCQPRVVPQTRAEFARPDWTPVFTCVEDCDVPLLFLILHHHFFVVLPVFLCMSI
jgi:hypothetical protein